jgi:dienelactone hydrolase
MERPLRTVEAICRGFFVLMLTHALLPGTANAQDQASIENISLPINSAFDRNARVIGELRVPTSNRDRLPAVLILGSSPGRDGRGAFYAEALNVGGIVSLDIDMFQGKGLPATPRHNLPHVYQALEYLARDPRIDANRLGIMGVSWGGNVAVLASFDELVRQYAIGERRFAAHLALYPGCWKHYALLVNKPGKWQELKPTIYLRTTGSPVRILAAEKNDYDDRDTCVKFVGALPADVQRHFSVIVYPGATFGWDSQFSSASYDAMAQDGKGGIVNIVADPAMAKQSRESAVAYFRRHLGVD